MRIAVLYICTGPYRIFWDEFYKSSNNYFLKKHEKHYFIFTDDVNFPKSFDITIIQKQCQGFPNDSLFRFQMFLEIKDQLLNYDYTYFFNSNMQFVDFVNEEIFPNLTNENGLVGVLHPGHYNKNYLFFPYERNVRSKAFIPFKTNHIYRYFMGGVNGGKTLNYIDLIARCAINIEDDYKKGIIAVYHDESHLNSFFFKNSCKILESNYGWPQNKAGLFALKIIIRDKTLFDKKFRKQSSNIFSRIYMLFLRLIKSFKWRMSL